MVAPNRMTGILIAMWTLAVASVASGQKNRCAVVPTSMVRGILFPLRKYTKATAVPEEVYEDVHGLLQKSCRSPRFLSCHNQCGKQQNNFFRWISCNCDADCVVRGDCCYDYHEMCVKQPPSTSHSQPRSMRDSALSCVTPFVPLGGKYKEGHYMTANCPDMWAGSPEIALKCQAPIAFEDVTIPGAERIQAHLPVYNLNEGKLFRNMYCAICNGFSMADFQFPKVDVNPRCARGLPDIARNESALAGLDLFDIMDEVIQTSSEGVSECINITLPAELTKDMACIDGIISSCPKNIDGDAIPESLRQLCEAYLAPLSLESVIFNNVHCALCHGYSLGDVVTLPEEILDDGEDTTQKPPKNPEDGIYKPVGCTDQSVCGVNFYLLLDFNHIFRGTSRAVAEEGGQTPRGADANTAGGAGTAGSQRCINKHCCPIGMVATDISTSDITSLTCDPETVKTSEHFTVYLQVTGGLPDWVDVSELANVLKRHFPDDIRDILQQNHTAIDIDSNSVAVQVTKVNTIYRYSLELAGYTPVFITSIIIHKYQSRFLTSVAQKSTKMILQEKLVPERSMSAIGAQMALLAVSRDDFSADTLPCKRSSILLSPENYNVGVNGSLTLTYQEGVNLQAGQYENVSGHLFTCEELLKSNGTIIRNISITELQSETDSRPQWLVILTTVLMLVSILCLFISIVTYSLLSELRVLPSRVKLNLMLALFLAQSLYLPSNYLFLDSPLACSIVAIVLHYLFLCTFSWMNVCAYNLYTTFCQIWSNKAAEDRPKLTLFLYMLYGWGMPAFVVTPCVLIEFAHVTDVFSVDYGTDVACWIGSPLVIIFFFAVPLGIVLLTNIYFFVRTIVAIAQSQGSMARSSTQKKSTRKDLLIYGRITVLMGFTWFLPFFTQIDQPYVSRITLVVLTEVFNSLQGVFIFVAYVLNSRIYKLYRDACRGKTRTESTHSNSTQHHTHHTTASDGRRPSGASLHHIITDSDRQPSASSLHLLHVDFYSGSSPTLHDKLAQREASGNNYV